MSDLSSIQREVEAEARRLFPGAVRRVEWLRHGDAPVIEPVGRGCRGPAPSAVMPDRS